MQGDSVNAFGTSERPPLLGEVHCIGSKPGWLECSHSSIGSHFCGQFHSPVPDVVISCHGIAHISFVFSYQLSNNKFTTGDTSCEEGEVRLRDSFDPSKVVWSTVTTGPGEQCVVMDGMTMMPESFVGS